ncbi:hypothetical protein [Rhodopseudomonas pseudopalustris]|uniref:Uncharacterized protein n=1 Tax=Rhodopseudomonas pseudopalustris TaxID=1513892 RepID=A0A1H8V9A7_9BRAD|nr:hypothetical protein [Rhodopseudomonas pseudopalustris]SEP11989.1 hypothetical protein SAMN05444123_108139 [Rhodopseudomonas pseudopalustris]
MTDAAPKIRAANIPPVVRIVRLRTRLQLSANKLEAIAVAVAAAGLACLADELEQEAAAMHRAARAS